MLLLRSSTSSLLLANSTLAVATLDLFTKLLNKGILKFSPTVLLGYKSNICSLKSSEFKLDSVTHELVTIDHMTFIDDQQSLTLS
jgi:hypothetical protein